MEATFRLDRNCCPNCEHIPSTCDMKVERTIDGLLVMHAWCPCDTAGWVTIARLVEVKL